STRSTLFPYTTLFRSEEYLKRADETLYSWRDRLFNIQRQTFVQAALHDLFYPYVEMVNPLFSNEIVNYTRELNDKERTGKNFYRSEEHTSELQSRENL